MSNLTRRAALGLLFAAAPFSAFAARRHVNTWPGGGLMVDVSPLRQYGDNTDADYLAETLPTYLRQAFGPSRAVRVRIDNISFGVPGSAGGSGNNTALDSIEGVGWVDGREAPLFFSTIATVSFPDIGGYAARQRQDQLSRGFAQWLPRQMGL